MWLESRNFASNFYFFSQQNSLFMFNTNFFASCLLYFFSFVSSPEPTEKTADEANKIQLFDNANSSFPLLNISKESDYMIDFCKKEFQSWKNRKEKIANYDKAQLLAVFNEWQAFKKIINLDLNKLRPFLADKTIPKQVTQDKIYLFEAISNLFVAMIDFENELENTIEALPDFDEVLFNALDKNMENAKFIDEETFWTLFHEEV